MVKSQVSESTSMMKLTKGRQKIEMKKIKETNSLQVAFSKRRNGLFKKVAEISVLIGAQATVLTTSPCGRFVFSFCHPGTDVVLGDNLDHNKNKKDYTNDGVDQRYMEVSRELEAEKKRGETNLVSSGGSRWFDEEVDGLNTEEAEEYLYSLEELKKKIDEQMIINSLFEDI